MEKQQPIQPNISPEIPQKPKLPTWAVSLIVVLSIAVISSVGYAVYQYFTPQQPEPPLCIDKCDDGICQEIVCQGTGCPCAETETSCPDDCKDETAGWQTYRNENYGYFFRYPLGWEVGMANNDPKFVFISSSKTGASLHINIASKPSPDPATVDVITWVEENVGGLIPAEADTGIPNEPNLEIGGLPAVKILYKKNLQAPRTEFYLIQNGKLFLITCYSVDEESDKICDQILSTFKFID